ncbi:hypothetical protein BGW80DRAFT_1466620 [Lactifluus volemus]|nr:hypothetical protein BGW80DRAFT_1466620 [Lactifluus volemus]
MRYVGSPCPSPVATGDEDNIIAALQHPNRINIIQLTVTTPLLERLTTLAHVPFPKLVHLELTTQTETGLTLPSKCFGGAAPLLRIIRTANIGFSALPQLLLSASNLVSLQLEAIPNTGYISPEALTTCLSTMTCLTAFHLLFLFPTSHPMSGGYQRPDPERYVVLPALKYFAFQGFCGYLEHLLSGIRTPPLKYIDITFFNQAAIFDTPQLLLFICRTDMPRSYDEAGVFLSGTDISLTLTRQGSPHRMGFRVRCMSLDWRLSCMAEICDKFFFIVSGVKQLDIGAYSSLPIAQDDMDHLSWSQFFRSFTNVERLRVAKEAASHVAYALGKEENIGILPGVLELHVEEHNGFPSVQKALIPLQRHYNHPITVHRWKSINDHQYAAADGHDRSTSVSTPSINRYDPILVLEKDFRDNCKHLCGYPHSVTIQSLFQQAQSLLLSFMQNGRAQELDNSLEISQDLLTMDTKEIPRVKIHILFAFSFALRSQEPGNMAKSVSMFETAFHDESTTTTEKIGIAWWWATFARVWSHPSMAPAYRSALSALQSLSSEIGFSTRSSRVSIGHLGTISRIPLEYASYQIERGQLELAIETIEQGKTLIWSAIYGLRPLLGRVRDVYPYLAYQFFNVSKALEAINDSLATHRVIGFPLRAREELDDIVPAQKHLRRLLRSRQVIIRQIQDLPGLGNFMKPIPYHTLQDAASQGPIVIINHCSWRCDILIVSHHSPPSLIPTSEGFPELATALATYLINNNKRALLFTLKELYKHVGEPVIQRFQEMGVPPQSRIWWYPTSVFCSLPLHSMGPIPSTSRQSQFFSDFYLCSYTSAIGALIDAGSHIRSIWNYSTSLLFVNPSGHFSSHTKNERIVVWESGIPLTLLIDGQATSQAIIRGLQRRLLAHISCDSISVPGDSFCATLRLDDNAPLTLLDVVRTGILTTKLAVLSASHTAGPYKMEGLEEGLHLVSAMHYHGVSSMVGTMWGMVDDDGSSFSEEFYKALLSLGAEDGVRLGEKSAEALRVAVQNLRNRGVPLERWVNWVHYGA